MWLPNIPLATAITLFILCILHQQSKVEARKGPRGPIVLDEESWTQLLEGEWMVDFYASWCPACKKLEPEWKKFADWSDDLNINVASADVTQNPGISGRFMVSGLPTIYHVKDGVFRQYVGPREHTALINFIEEQGWMRIEPISKWRAPNTLQMSLVAYSFRISLALRDVHNYLVEEVGLPYYVSYLMFALGTVLIGSILGLVIVFIIDQFYPPRHAQTSVKIASKRDDQITKVPVKKKEKSGEADDSDQEDDRVSDKAPLRRRTKN